MPYFAFISPPAPRRRPHTSYVAERQGGGPHDLLRGFDSFRNCFVIVFMATMVRPKPGGVFTLPFFYGPSQTGICPPPGCWPTTCTPFGIGSVLFIRLTGIGCKKAELAITQDMWSGCMIRTGGPALIVNIAWGSSFHPRAFFIGDVRVSRRNCA